MLRGVRLRCGAVLLGALVVGAPAAEAASKKRTLVAAGDIACRPGLSETSTRCRQVRTARLVGRLAPDAVAMLGDAQEEHGELEHFLAAYHPTWGRFKSITRPVIGNHEYTGVRRRNRAPGYFEYFGAAAGKPRRGYYSWKLGKWHMFALNSGVISYTRVGPGAARRDDCWPVSCARGSRQERWLRSRLRRLPRRSCVLAYWHYPRFSSGFGGRNQSYDETAPLFEALYDHGADLVLTAHSHNYERFRSVNPAGRPSRRGMTQFVVGTGGSGRHRRTGRPLTSTLRTRMFGVLELTLGPRRWRSRFVNLRGRSKDPARGAC
jgi:acid phosphatase type 7